MILRDDLFIFILCDKNNDTNIFISKASLIILHVLCLTLILSCQ